jgi:hypothetical protein
MNKILLLLLGFTLTATQLNAQSAEFNKNKWELFQLRLKKAPKAFSYGWSVIDDNGKAYLNVLSPKSFNANIVPLTFNYDLYYGNGMFFSIKTTFCNFKRNKLVNGSEIQDSHLLFGLDFNTSISMNSVFNPNTQLLKLKKNIFDVRLIGGLGYTNRNIYVFDHAANFNLGGGIYARFNKEFGMYVEMLGKLGLKAPLIGTNSNYVHTFVGVTYFIGNVKFASPKSNIIVPKLD